MTASLPEVINGCNCYAGGSAPVLALVAFYSAFNRRDVDAMGRSWSHDGNVSMSNPLGGVRRGWPEVREVYERIFRGPAEVYVEFYDYAILENADSFLAVGRERGYARRNGAEVALAIRTSRFFQRVNGRYLQVHHHGSIEEPALLARYQNLVRGEAAQAPLLST